MLTTYSPLSWMGNRVPFAVVYIRLEDGTRETLYAYAAKAKDELKLEISLTTRLKED